MRCESFTTIFFENVCKGTVFYWLKETKPSVFFRLSKKANFYLKN